MKRTIPIVFAGLAVLGVLTACERGGAERNPSSEEEVEIDEDLGTLKVMNNVDEPVTVYVNGQEIYAVPPGQAYTFRNLPTGKTTIYGVGRVSQKHYPLPDVEIEEGGDYEWTIHP
jgi:hypothetical protein